MIEIQGENEESKTSLEFHRAQSCPMLDLGEFSDYESAVNAANNYLEDEGVEDPDAANEKFFTAHEGLQVREYTVTIE